MPRRERKEEKKSDKVKKKKRRAINREFAIVTYCFVALFMCLMGYVVYFNVVRAGDLIKSPYNERLDTLAKRVTRGSILDKNGNVLAETITDVDGTETRNYPYANIFAQVVGYNEQGKSGLESATNFDLLTSNAFFLSKIKYGFQDKKNPGDNVVTTLDADLQQAAYSAMGDNKGAVVAIDPRTGEIRAMLSKPDFDPNQVVANWDFLSTDQDSALLNRATQGQYVPGSVFKLATTLEYMRENPAYSSYYYNCTGEISAGGPVIHCFDGAVHGEVDLASSFAVSCNTSYSNIGLSLSADEFKKTTEELLFNKELPSDLPATKSSFALLSNDGDSAKMMTAIGQGQTMVSPYHMALITSAIANEGKLMTPHLVQATTNNAGSVVKETKSKEYKTLMTPEEAAQLREYMKGVVAYGTGQVLNEAGYQAAGKTGTAEYSDDKSKDHSWFVGIYEPDAPQLVISVIIEGADGNARAINVAKAVFDAYVPS
jgi:peptidoglycan glycosyltransferase